MIGTARLRGVLRSHGVELTVLLAVAVFFGLVAYADAGAVADAFRGFDWTTLLAVVGVTTVGFGFRFLKWEYYLRRLDIDVPTTTSLLVFLSGLMMVITPMKGGGVWKGWLLRDVEGVPISRIVSVVVAERTTDLLALCGLAAIGLVVYRRSSVVLVLVVASFAAMILLIQWRRFCLDALDRCRGLPLVGRYAADLETAYEDAYALFRLRPLAASFGLSLCAWTAEGLSVWLVLRGFGVEASPLVSWFVFGLGSVVGGVSMLPGGLAATEASIVGLLVAFDYPRAVAASTTIVVRVGTLWYGAALGTVVFGGAKLWWARRTELDPS